MIEQRAEACQLPGSVLHEKSPVLLMPVRIIQDMISNLHLHPGLGIHPLRFFISIQAIPFAEDPEFLERNQRRLLRRE